MPRVLSEALGGSDDFSFRFVSLVGCVLDTADSRVSVERLEGCVRFAEFVESVNPSLCSPASGIALHCEQRQILAHLGTRTNQAGAQRSHDAEGCLGPNCRDLSSGEIGEHA